LIRFSRILIVFAQLLEAPLSLLPERSSPPSTVAEWLESPYLRRVATRVALQHGLDLQDLPDLLQELSLALWLTGAEVRVNATWVFQTAHHKALDAIGRARRNARALAVPLEEGHAIPSQDPDLARLLRSRADRLPEVLRRFYSLRYEEGLSQREIGRRLRLCRSSVRWLDHRCLRMLKGRA
jgi:RNA polymerase sigma factor (sigma-70 family)